MGSSALSLTLLLMSFIHSGLTQDLPRSTLTVTPDNTVFTGERVRLKCVITPYYNNWKYDWWRGNTYYTSILQPPERYTVKGNTLTIEGSQSSDTGQYTCRGHIEGRYLSSQSNSVSLSVKDLKPTPELTSDPAGAALTGDTVTLTCRVNLSPGWDFYWYKDTLNSETKTETNSYSVEIDSVSDGGQYWCRAGRGIPVYYTQYSDALWVNVTVSPKAVVTVRPDEQVFRGETVSLRCDIMWGGDIEWTYRWETEGTNYQYNSISTQELNIRSVDYSHRGKYTCTGLMGTQRSRRSDAVTLTVSDLPKPQLTVDPESLVFTGETVKLKCVIESYRDWTYEWYKGTDRVKIQSSDRYTVNTHTLTIRGATKSDAGQFWCKVQRYGSPSSSQESNRIYLTVNDLPKPKLTVDPKSPVFTGERVILTCVIESDHRDWRYEWKKGYTYYTSISQSSQRLTVERNTLTIEGSESSDEGQYTCRGHIEGRSVSSQSSSVSLSVKALPRSTLTVTPDNTVFTGERVRLTCVIESYRDWRYEWNKDSVKLQLSQRLTVERNTLTIEGSESSDEGQYTCRGHIEGRSVSSQSSSAVSLSVKDLPKTKLTVDPKSPVFTGETVNLKCVIESNHTDWRYEWNKDSVKLQSSDRYTVNTDTLTIRGLNESDRGQFWCRGQRDENKRPNSSQESERINLSVNASSSRLVTGVVVGSSVCLLFFLSLLLMWRYKKNKDQQRNINQTSVPNQSAQSQLENFPLQSDSDHIYDDVTEVNKRDKDDSDPLTDVTYSEVTVKKKMDKAKAESNNVTYSEVGKRGKKCESKDINPAGASDLTYAQINIQDKKKTKGKGKSSESGDTLYSELKQNTDRDADAGVGDTTSALAFWKKGQKKINKTCP